MKDTVSKEPVINTQFVGGLDQVPVFTREPFMTPSRAAWGDIMLFESRRNCPPRDTKHCSNLLHAHFFVPVPAIELLAGGFFKAALLVALAPCGALPRNTKCSKPVSDSSVIDITTTGNFGKREMVFQYPVTKFLLSRNEARGHLVPHGDAQSMEGVENGHLVHSKECGYLAGTLPFVNIEATQEFRFL